MTVSLVLIWIAKHLRYIFAGIVVAIIVSQAGCIKLLNDRLGTAKAKLPILEQELAFTRGEVGKARTQLRDQNAAIEKWRAAALDQADAVEVAKEEVERVRIVSSAKLGRLETEIAQLQLRLAALPEAERCEAAARWVEEKYREVADGR